MARLGIISDTHGYFDPLVERHFAGVAHILHAGDVGPRHVLHELEAIAPVTAVLGNTHYDIGLNLTEVVALGGRKLLLQHIVQPLELTEELRARIARERPAAVVFGHTHRACAEVHGGVLFLNPGPAGRSRLGQQRSVAILELTGRQLSPRFIRLPPTGGPSGESH